MKQIVKKKNQPLFKNIPDCSAYLKNSQSCKSTRSSGPLKYLSNKEDEIHMELS